MTTLSISQAHSWPLNGLKIFAGSLLLALAAQASFVIPYTPIFVTLQTAALLLIGFFLGPVRGSLSVILYLAEGAMGLPVFALGQAGLGLLLGPKGGFYIGFILTAWIAGFAKQEDSTAKTFFLFSLALSATFLAGISWLALFVGVKQALVLGSYPFILGDLMKAGLVTALVKTKTCHY